MNIPNDSINVNVQSESLASKCESVAFKDATTVTSTPGTSAVAASSPSSSSSSSPEQNEETELILTCSNVHDDDDSATQSEHDRFVTECSSRRTLFAIATAASSPPCRVHQYKQPCRTAAAGRRSKVSGYELLDNTSVRTTKKVHLTSASRNPEYSIKSYVKKCLLVGIMLSIFVFILLTVNLTVAQYSNDQKGALYQQKHETVGRIDLSKYEHLQRKTAPPTRVPVQSTRKPEVTPRPTSSARVKQITKDEVEREWTSRSNRVRAFQLSLKIASNVPRRITPFVYTEPTAAMREVEFDPVPDTSVKVNEQPVEPKVDSVPVKPRDADDCSSCVAEKYLAHYRRRGCSPVFSRTCNCARYFRCSDQSFPKPRADECEYEGRIYQLGEQILSTDMCRDCTCAQNWKYPNKKSALIHCGPTVECPELAHGVRPKPDCWFSYSREHCCGQERCGNSTTAIRGATKDRASFNLIHSRVNHPETVKCQYKGKSYHAGQRIYPSENVCVDCICDAQWNESDPANSPSCQPFHCKEFGHSHLLHDCTPIYRPSGCCPIDFLCGKQKTAESSRNMKRQEQQCELNGRYFDIGERTNYNRATTYKKKVCASCVCHVPPLLTCTVDTDCQE